MHVSGLCIDLVSVGINQPSRSKFHVLHLCGFSSCMPLTVTWTSARARVVLSRRIPLFQRAGRGLGTRLTISVPLVYNVCKTKMATSGEVTTSSEALALKNAFKYLVDSIDTDSLLPAALSRKLITEYQREDCSCEPDRYKKAGKFIGHLLRAVNGDSNNYHVFIQVLFDCDQPSIARRIHG